MNIHSRENVLRAASDCLLVAASYPCSESVVFLCFVLNLFCASFNSALNLRFDLILGGGG